jgi:hypothetical protein
VETSISHPSRRVPTTTTTTKTQPGDPSPYFIFWRIASAFHFSSDCVIDFTLLL